MTPVVGEWGAAMGLPGWERKMAWQTQHKLERVEITFHLPDVRTGRPAGITAHGCTSTKRGFLWTHSEQWVDGEMHDEGYEPCDLVHHIMLVCAQDQPNSAARLAYGLTGGLSWSEEELPFS